MKQYDKKGIKNQVGAYGEQITVNYLKRAGFVILEVNYLKKWGEIDVVARETKQNNLKIHFVEVKTVSYETKAAHNYAVSHRTWRPEEQVTSHKLIKLQRAIASWQQENNSTDEWQIDIAAVRIVPRETYATITYISDVIL